MAIGSSCPGPDGIQSFKSPFILCAPLTKAGCNCELVLEVVQGNLVFLCLKTNHSLKESERNKPLQWQGRPCLTLPCSFPLTHLIAVSRRHFSPDFACVGCSEEHSRWLSPPFTAWHPMFFSALHLPASSVTETTYS